MQQMICGNTQAEIDHDKFVSDTEQRAEEERMSEQWSYIRDRLLSGNKVYTYGAAYDLNEHIINKYHKELNPDYNFVEGYARKDIDQALRNLVEREADALASVIVG